MTADLVLLSLAVAFAIGGICHLVIAIKRIAQRAFSEALDGYAREYR